MDQAESASAGDRGGKKGDENVDNGQVIQALPEDEDIHSLKLREKAKRKVDIFQIMNIMLP
jgi:hypothetical protein